MITLKQVVIVGAGISGLMAAQQLAEKAHVILITKTAYSTTNSAMAQGGIAAAVAVDDNPTIHFEDTLQAGHFVNNKDIVKKITEAAPSIIKELEALGVSFDEDDDHTYSLGMEGAHQKRRILHANKDQTGYELVNALWKQIQGRVEIHEKTTVSELLVENEQVYGVVANNNVFRADMVVLASGGAGQLYQCTSNSTAATGDGLYLAYQAGAILKDLEYIQFHPTVLKASTSNLISEAVRGEGAFLIDENGKRLLASYPRQELEGRDTVSSVLHSSLQKKKRVFLDVRHIDRFAEQFPYINQVCQNNGINPRLEPIPVEPGAHFLCGGVEVDEDGCTTIKGLYAIGEVACSGTHGSNRLASNSLLEAIYYAKAVAQHVTKNEQTKRKIVHKVRKASTCNHALPERAVLQQKMTRYAGIERTEAGLTLLKDWLLTYKNKPITAIYSAEDIALFQLALLITEASLLRQETRGTHRRMDYPVSSKEWETKSICFCKQIIYIKEAKQDERYQVN